MGKMPIAQWRILKTARSRMNGLRTNVHSDFYHALAEALSSARPFSEDKTAIAILAPEQARHPLVIEMVEYSRRAEEALADKHPGQGKRRGRLRGFSDHQEHFVGVRCRSTRRRHRLRKEAAD